METFDKIWEFLGQHSGQFETIAAFIAIGGVGVALYKLFKKKRKQPPVDQIDPDAELLEKIKQQLADDEDLEEADVHDLKAMRRFLKKKSLDQIKKRLESQGYQPDAQTEENRDDALEELAEQGNEEQLQALTEFSKGEIDVGLDTLIAEAKKASENLAAKWRQIGELAYGVNVGDAVHAYKKVITLAPEEDIWDHIYLARLYVLSSQLEQARQTIEQAFPLAEENSRIASALSDELGNIFVKQGNLDQALSYFQDALEVRKKLAELDPTNSQAQRDLSVSYERIGDIHKAQGNLDKALTNFQEGLAIRKKLDELDPTNSQAQRDLSVSFNKIGDVHQAQGNLDEALANFQEGLVIRKKLVELDPTNSQAQRDLSISFNKIGDIHQAQGDLGKALTNFQEGLEIAKKLAELDPTNSEAQRDLSISFNKIGDIHQAQGNLDKALTNFQGDLEIAKKLAELDPTNSEAQRDLSVSYEGIGEIHKAQGNLDKALANFQDALEIRKKLAEQDPTNSEAQRDIGVSLAKLAGHPESKVTWQQVYEHFKGMNDKGVLAPVDAWMVEDSFDRAQEEAAAQ